MFFVISHKEPPGPKEKSRNRKHFGFCTERHRDTNRD